MVKKTAEVEKENGERWLLTYADLITLLLIFFIVLYSMSSISSKKFDAMAASLSIVFGGVGKSGLLDGGRSLIPGEKLYKQRREMQNTEERIRRMIAQMGLEGKISVSRQERGLVVSVKDTVLFVAGSADLTPFAQEIVSKVGQILSEIGNPVRVEGHTDNDPIHTPRFFSNWELSTARATNVLQYLISNVNLPPSRLSAAGYGEYKPAVPNDNPRNKALNRRVDIVILGEEFAKFEPQTLDTSRAESSPTLSQGLKAVVDTAGTDLLPEDKP